MRTAWRALLWAIALLVLTFCMINIHEVGHTVAAWLAGDHGAYYALYQTYPNGTFNCIGCNHYDPSLLTFWGKLAVAAGGVLATQAVFAVALLAMRRRRRPVGRAVLIMWFVVFVLGDAAYQTLQGLIAPVSRQMSITNVDFADVLFLVHRHWHISVAVLKPLLAGLAAIYVLVAAWAAFAWTARRGSLDPSLTGRATVAGQGLR